MVLNIVFKIYSFWEREKRRRGKRRRKKKKREKIIFPNENIFKAAKYRLQEVQGPLSYYKAKSQLFLQVFYTVAQVLHPRKALTSQGI